MAYSKQDLQEAISEYRAGTQSVRAIAKSFNIQDTTLKDCVIGDPATSSKIDK